MRSAEIGLNKLDSIFINKRRKIVIEGHKSCVVCKKENNLIEGQLKLSDVKVTFYIHENCKTKFLEQMF
mgnify:CR=1 FL=1|jgi:hypothetical protein|tara:strand:+ start:2073 stop:2279 length:207 start_codon:yes stop_codon:yes gene_type:complete